MAVLRPREITYSVYNLSNQAATLSFRVTGGFAGAKNLQAGRESRIVLKHEMR